MEQVDFGLVRRRIAEAATQAFEALRTTRPGERFYAFALTTLDDGLYVTPSASSEEGLLRRAAEDGEDVGEQRWNPFDWAYEQAEAERFDDVNALLGEDGDGFYDEDDPVGFEKYRAGIMAAMVLGLQDAAAAGAFGGAAERASLTLFCTIADSADAEWFALDSAERLNPRAVFDTFAREWAETMGEPEEDDGDPDVREVYLALVAPR